MYAIIENTHNQIIGTSDGDFDPGEGNLLIHTTLPDHATIMACHFDGQSIILAPDGEVTEDKERETTTKKENE